ncbi:B12-binding domain-containing radical SAM protein [Picrophilus oshimae]|uniref:Fe-S oxidoreductase n=1 Tax=Picrophilus torridus (strain ATCC 700027 / DSM 9790 / JCM 10055 / NBRC 100828 / KAW 2/3) TaxID=1122961 RepID=Q6L0I1_PICTO|nr:radical SAM protein [Picrophilus oshimae]AAT43521.1 Fe-S oxidoreductase [Picrophilus oshimae DSM 9789]SMD30167.1 Radical SAM superfamily enzyme YgiQ, UPF0313 family [Picrophilus oshimae DSM 9789]
MNSVILTSDRGTFTNFGGMSTLGYVACLPYRVVPRPLMNYIFAPEVRMKNGEPEYVPYALRKVEAALHANGITDVSIIPPQLLEKYVNENTKVLGINVHDPYGLSPVTFKLTMLFGGGESWTAKFFDELSETVSRLKSKYHFKVIIGGPAAWQIGLKKPDWVDTVFNGEAELDFPLIVKKALNGEELPGSITGRMPKVNEIPTIIKPARFGEVQVTRGCPRGCQFCSITPETFRSIPYEDIEKEVKLNLSTGYRDIELVSDDILLYGQKKLQANEEALVKLFTMVKNLGARYITFPHISAPGVLSAPKVVNEISEIAGLKEYMAEAPVVGLETGSVKIMRHYMNAKPFPWKPEDWKYVITNATPIMNDAAIFPCYTMTIGYPEETDDDLDQSIDIALSIIDNKFKAWVFPLPVIPMTSSHIKDNPFPYMDKLPSKYWDLLYISWKYDLYITRIMMPHMSKKMNPVLSGIVNMMTSSIFSHIEDVFRELAETHGHKAEDFANINLNTVTGFIKSMYWLTRATVSTSASRNPKKISS